MVRERGFRVVIIDSLAAVRTATDGAKETLKLLRELRQLTHEMDVSMLVVTDADSPSRARIASEADLRRSRVLCSAAESVFAVGLHPRGGTAGTRYIVQTRSKNAAVVWTEHNAPLACIERQPAGMLALAFDERFIAGVDDATREIISRIKTLRDEGKTYTEVAAELEISRSRVVRLIKKWRSEAGSEQLAVSNEPEEVDGERLAVSSEQEEVGGGQLEVGGEDPSAEGKDIESEDYDEAGYLRDCGLADPDKDPANGQPPTADDSEITAECTPRSVYDLPVYRDRCGEPYYIAKTVGPNKYVTLFYRVNKENILLRCERRGYGVFMTRVGPAPYLPKE